MSGICDTCKRESCHMRFDGCKTCDVYEGGETRFERLFGTPERAAQTIAAMMDKCSDRPHGCDGCMLFDVCDDEANVLEWLRGDDELIDEPDTIRNELMDGGLLRGDA